MRYHTTTRPVLDDDGKQIGFEQIDIPFTPEEEIEWDAMEAQAVIDAEKARIPKSVSMRQARLALLAADLLDTVDAAINQAGGAAKIEWEYAATVERDSTLVSGMTAALGLTEQQLDDLFLAAGAL